MNKSMNPHEGYTKLCSAGDNMEASVLKTYLEDSEVTVYIQGANHRSMLGMVGAYIDLNILVLSEDLERAQELMHAYHAAEPEIDEDDAAEFRGAYRDEQEKEEEESEPWIGSLEYRHAIKRARMAAFIFPFGGAHFSAGANVRGVALASIVLGAIWAMINVTPNGFILWPLAVAVDAITVRSAVNRGPVVKQLATKN